MQLVKQRNHYYKYQSYRKNGKVSKRYYGRANIWEIIIYKISRFFRETGK
jgi:hypothetical protein